MDTRTTTSPDSVTLSPRLLAQAPHRLMFFIGASNVLLAMLWWTAWLVSARWPLFAMPQPQPYAGWLHAFVMQYQMLSSFVFGFLLTVFPRWMGLREFERWRYVPVGLGLFGGQVATLLGAIGWSAGIVVGLAMTIGGWVAALATLAPLLWREPGTTWHARSCFAALLFGFAGLLAWTAYVLGASPWWAFASIKLGSFGLLLPLYVTVAHRMFPFALYAAQSVGYLLFVGFFGSVLVAMVTRVTQGHSGRALVMPKAAWFAFVAIQLVALLRISAEFANDAPRWQAIAALGWLMAMTPWVTRIGRIYLSPRKDGKPG